MKRTKEPILKVGILNASTLSFELKGVFHCKGRPIPAGKYTASLINGEISCSFATGNHIQITPAASGTFVLRNVIIGIGFHWEQQEDQEFEGGLTLCKEAGKIRAINTIGLESYLKSVISSEMSAMNNSTLLKVHAIVSRSWLLAQIQNSPQKPSIEYIKQENSEEITKWYDREDHHHFDVCADDHCQRYQGISKVISTTANRAVAATSGQVISYLREICDARFSKCCGGISEDFEYVWAPVKVPYLTSVRDSTSDNLKIDESYFKQAPDSYCNTNDTEVLKQVLIDFDRSTTNFYRWKIVYSQQQIAELIKKNSNIDFGSILELEAVERGNSGRINRLRIVGSKQTRVVGKELEIRKWLSESHLYSSAFIVEKVVSEKDSIPTEFILHGAGWGHGVGMCQIGAAVMSKKGFSVQQILTHYFPHTNISKLY